MKNSSEQRNDPAHPGDWSWTFWLAAPLYPYGRRRTICTEVVKETIWTFDQVQGILYVVVPIRMTVVKLEAGGLLVYAPVAPTPECIRFMKELEAAHGEVKYIILPTVSAIEHKVFVGPFARKFPNAQVFVSPHQWSFPVNLPLSWLGFPAARTHRLPQEDSQASQTVPFLDEFDYAILGPIDLGLGPYEEVAVFHRRSGTLLIVDAVLSVPEEPPAIVQLDPYALLFHARETALDDVEDTPEQRRKGWQRISLFSFYFRPSALDVVQLGQTIRNAFKSADRSKRAYFGLFPFRWKAGWQRSFAALRGGGRLFVAPVLQRLILNRDPREVITWADKVASWGFQRIIPCHFDAPLDATPDQFRQAFAFLEKRSVEFSNVLPEEDFEFLGELEESLSRRGVTPPPKEKV
ncbi:DUF4336 domain-containing protein [Phormidium tenue FACHB-886]|nr:DUF4336 domain-containing protein [Phormidium tenue FACHB-886]